MEDKASTNNHLSPSSSTKEEDLELNFFKNLMESGAVAIATKTAITTTTETPQSDNDTSFKELADRYERIVRTAQAECNKLKNYLEMQLIVIDQQAEANFFSLVAHLKEEYARVVAENVQIRVDLVSREDTINRLNKTIKELEEQNAELAGLGNEITRLGNIIARSRSKTAIVDPLTNNNYSESTEEDEGIVDNTSGVAANETIDTEVEDHSAATAVVANNGTELLDSAEFVTPSSTSQPITENQAAVAVENAGVETENVMPETPANLSDEITTVKSNLSKEFIAPVLSSRFSVHDDCQNAMERISDRDARYIIFKIVEEKIVVDVVKTDEDIGIECGNDYEDNSKQAYEAFLNDLKNSTDQLSDCRYAVFDFKFQVICSGGGKSNRDKVIFIYFCADKAKIKKKMVYALSCYELTSALGKEKLNTFQATESELSHEEILNKMIDKCSGN